MYRLTIDIPVGEDLEKAKEIALNTLENVKDLFGNSPHDMSGAQYRLQKDSDKVQRNYLDLDKEGHARTNKLKFF